MCDGQELGIVCVCGYVGWSLGAWPGRFYDNTKFKTRTENNITQICINISVLKYAVHNPHYSPNRPPLPPPSPLPSGNTQTHATITINAATS